jgi:protein-S-isoprenylcysteine O-methyltransferase Ste14
MPLHIWASNPAAPAVMIAFIAGSGVFFALLAVARSRRQAAASQKGGQDWVSIAGVAIQGLAIALCAGPPLVNGPFLPADQTARLAAVMILMALTVGLFGWAIQTMGKNWSIMARTNSDHELVTDGPFALIRNPIYLALFAFMLAVALTTGHVQALIIGIPLYAVGTAMRVGREERLLRAHFGASYEAYAARVSRFIPGLF